VGRSFFSFITIYTFDRQRDRWTDGHLARGYTAAAYLQRGKRVVLIVTVKYFAETKQTCKKINLSVMLRTTPV